MLDTDANLGNTKREARQNATERTSNQESQNTDQNHDNVKVHLLKMQGSSFAKQY